MRFLLLALAFTVLVPATAFAAPAAVVDGEPVDAAAVDREARKLEYMSLREARPRVLEDVVRRVWERREADALGIVATAEEVARFEARERRLVAGEYRSRGFAAALRGAGLTPEAFRARAHDAIRARKLRDRFLLEAPAVAAYDARFTSFHAVWRARTTCAAAYRNRDVCGDAPPPRDPCTAIGVVDLCFYPKSRDGAAFWSIFDDAADALAVYNNHDAQTVLDRALRRRDRALWRRVEFDSEADYLGVSGRRADLVAAARVLHELTLRKPTPPLLGPYG